MSETMLDVFYITAKDKGGAVHELGKYFTRGHAETHAEPFRRHGAGWSDVTIDPRSETVAEQHPSHRDLVKVSTPTPEA